MDRFSIEREESYNELAEEIAKGNIHNNISYQAYLKLNDIDGLKKLHKTGEKILKSKNQNSKIYTNYEWLN